MPKRIEVNTQDGEVKESSRRFDERDFKWLADWGVAEWDRRVRSDERRTKEKEWKDIDRQIAMQPEVSYKKLPDGSMDTNKAWMAEMELPLQAQALEVLTADARRMMLPDSGPWFKAHAEVTDKYLENVDFKGIILGDEMQVPSQINQEDADKLTEGFLNHCFRQYDLRGRLDQINAEAFKYGMGVARARRETKSVYIHESSGTRSDKQRIPVIVPVSIKNVLLDDSKPSMHSAQMLGPVHISYEWMRYANLAIAASKGGTDPDDEDGGWIPKNIGKVQPDKKGFVQIIEIEGDIVVPRKTVRSVVLPGCILTIALGGAENKDSPASRAVIRLRFRKHPYSSYLLFPYHFEGSESVYPTSPLMKGRPLQMLCTDALNRTLDSAMLKCLPPVGYDPSNAQFAQSGGPKIYPQAIWETSDPVKVYQEVGGDPSQLFQIMMQGIGLYASLTGVLPARLGAQTISHTTAYAKGTELQQGATRTVDYVNAAGHGPITRWLHMAYDMGRDALPANKDISFFIKDYGGYVEIDKSMLPEKSGFEWNGSGGPQDEQQKQQAQVNSLMLALKIDQIRIQMGKPPLLNLDNSIVSILKKGQWDDPQALISINSAPGGAAPAPGVPGADQNNPGAVVAALQNLGSAGG